MIKCYYNGKVNIRFNETLNKDYKDDIVYKVLYKSEDKTHILYVKDGNYNTSDGGSNSNTYKYKTEEEMKILEGFIRCYAMRCGIQPKQILDLNIKLEK